LIAAVGLVIGVAIKLALRWFDKRAELLKPGYAAAGEAITALDKIAAKAAVRADRSELAEPLSKLKQAEGCYPKIPFGLAVACLEAYQETMLPDDYLDRLANDSALLELYLDLSRQQGIRSAAARRALETVQRKIEKRTRR
jgi:hypothetical protein